MKLIFATLYVLRMMGLTRCYKMAVFYIYICSFLPNYVTSIPTLVHRLCLSSLTKLCVSAHVYMGVRFYRGSNFPFFLMIFAWALQQCSATALAVIVTVSSMKCCCSYRLTNTLAA